MIFLNQNKLLKVLCVFCLLVVKNNKAQVSFDLFESPDSMLCKVIRSEIEKTKNKKKCVLVIVNRGRGKNGSESAKRDSLIKCHIQTNEQLSKDGLQIYSRLLEDDKTKHKFMYILYAETIDQAKKYFKTTCYDDRSASDSEEWWGPTTLQGIKEVALNVVKQ